MEKELFIEPAYLKQIDTKVSQLLRSSEVLPRKVLNILEIFLKSNPKILDNAYDYVWQIKEIIMNSIIKNGVIPESEKFYEMYEIIDEIISEHLLMQTISNNPLYYKNLLNESCWNKFEKSMDFFEHEMHLFYKNLFYTKKILQFYKEFSQDGAFPTDLIFLNTFVTTSFSNIILTCCKLFYEGRYKSSCVSFGYILTLINRNLREGVKLPNNFNDKVKKIKIDVISKIKPLEDIRDNYIAHYQEGFNLNDNTIDFELIQTIFNNTCDIFEILSLFYFQGKDEAYYDLIKLHGFKKIICQNTILDNIYNSDIDGYLDYLRGHFFVQLKII